MAVVDDITEANSRADFLEGTTTQHLAKSLASDVINGLANNFRAKIEEEMNKGLSLKALSLEGRAPLNDIAREMVLKIDTTIGDFEEAKTITVSKGNDHTIQEADRFLDEVLKKYAELCRGVRDTAYQGYNQAYRTVTTYDDDGEKTTKKIYSNGSIKIEYKADRDGPTRITMEPMECPDRYFVKEFNAVKDLYDKAAKYFDGKVTEAIKFWISAKDLTVQSTGEVPASTNSDENNLPPGVKPGATIVEGEDSSGKKEITYINEDGSYVSVTYDDGNPDYYSVRNKYGYTTEFGHYDENGNITDKTTYDYKRVDGHDHVYAVKKTHYELNENGEFYSTGTEDDGYAYPGAAGIITYRTENGLPDASDVGEPETEAERKEYLEFIKSEGNIIGTVGETGTDTSANSNTGTVVDKSGNQYVIPRSYEDLRDNIASEEAGYKDFMLTPGQVLKVDAKGSWFKNYNSIKSYPYFKYDEKTGKYYGYTAAGGKGTFGFDPKDLQWGQDGNSGNNSELKIDEYTQNQIDQFYEGNISQEEVKQDAWKQHMQQQKTWAGNPPEANSDAKTYNDSTSGLQQEVDSAVETLESQTTT